MIQRKCERSLWPGTHGMHPHPSALSPTSSVTNTRMLRSNNAKVALVSGMALGFGKPLLMLAHEPYASPVDYRDLLKTHATASRCEALTGEWLTQLEQTVSATSSAIGEIGRASGR